MHTEYSEETSSHHWFCVWGCTDYGYLSADSAERGFMHHVCHSRVS